MKIQSLALVAALAVAPLSAFAQQPPQGGPGMGGPGPSSQQMQQMRRLHEQARAKILAALTPAHKALLAQIVGNLSTTENPNYEAAVKQLDAALSPSEKQTILSVHDEIRKQIASTMPNGGQRHPMHRGVNRNDPGAILLFLSHPTGGPMGGPPPH